MCLCQSEIFMSRTTLSPCPMSLATVLNDCIEQGDHSKPRVIKHKLGNRRETKTGGRGTAVMSNRYWLPFSKQRSIWRVSHSGACRFHLPHLPESHMVCCNHCFCRRSMISSYMPKRHIVLFHVAIWGSNATRSLWVYINVYRRTSVLCQVSSFRMHS